jgi:chromosome segregation protein
MRLKRLELFGFKSFADRTALDFQQTLTGIVGPNGCGKSNVVDAVRWVLGEQRPTSMRGGEMADVIFKGSASRPRMSLAEVTLVLDNAQGELATQGAEVSITRRVMESGEGEYLIDGERVRLKDVRDLLFDTGLGSRGYAVLEQGRIDAVLSANPLDRRAIFEEAAGISRYRQRKKETEARLKRVEADMQRIDDVLRELGSRVRSLKIQAGKAERFVAARDAWRRERERSLRHRVHTDDVQLAALGADRAALEERAQDLRLQRSGGESDVSAREREQQELALEVDRLAAEAARILGEGRALDERHEQTLMRIASLRAAATEEGQRALHLAGQLEVREAELEALQAEAQGRAQAAGAAETRAQQGAEVLRQVKRSVADLRARSTAQNEAVLGLLHEKTGAANRLRHLGDARGPLEARRARAAARVSEHRAAHDALASEAAELRAAVVASEAALERAESERAAARSELAELEGTVAEQSAERAELELAAARLSARIAALRDIERERESLEQGTRAVLASLEQGEQGHGPCAPGEVLGLLADHLSAASEDARALDAALDASALALVVESPELAQRITAWLASDRLGRVRLLLRAGGERTRAAPAWSEDERQRVSGRLLERVRCDERCTALVQTLLADVWLARDLESALWLAQRYPELRFVTPAGELAGRRVVQGGHRELASGAVGRRSSAAELAAELQRLEVRGTAVAAALARASAARDARRAELGRLDARSEAARTDGEQQKGREQAARARLSALAEALAVAEHEDAGAALELAELTAEEARGRAELARSEAGFAQENAALAELESERHAAEAERDRLQHEEHAASVELARVKAELAGLESRAADLARSCDETHAELERARRLAREAERGTESAAGEVTALREQAAALMAERTELERRLTELRATERAGRQAIEGSRRRVDEVTRELEDCLARVAELRLAEQKLELERTELFARALEELALAEDDVRAGFVPEPELASEAAMAELEASVAELKRALDALGNVNTEAVAELEESEGRFKFLDSERADLVRSRQNLAETLRTINDESVRLFLETFEDVRGHFQQLFRQLFGGGRADLVLAAGEDPLEAGIEITARPPGREMLPIGLLSGGQRTLTALALLFAVFQARPSPFCVLDEVDAALDDANVGRFLSMLDHFRQHTQFIVVTHNKGSMAACDALYGITMETKGVSRHVAVEFREVDRFDPEATGDAEAASRARAGAEGPPGEPGAEPGAALGPEAGERLAVVELERAAPRPPAVRVS